MFAITSARANLAPGITILSTQGFNPDLNNEGFSSDAYSALATAISAETDPQKQKERLREVRASRAARPKGGTVTPRAMSSSRPGRVNAVG